MCATASSPSAAARWTRTQPAKYLNSPETPLFHKGDTLYNIAAARQATHDGATPVVVEGYVDVIAMVNAGFPAAVAPLGTALTENQLALLWRMADEPILCFDGDRAGQKAAFRAADLALPHLKPGKSLALRAAARRPGPGRSRALRRPRARSRRWLPLRVRSPKSSGCARSKAARYATPERRAALEARIGELSQSIRDEVVRKYYRQDLQERLQRAVPAGRQRPQLSRRRQGQGRRLSPAPAAIRSALSVTRHRISATDRPGRGVLHRPLRPPSARAPIRRRARSSRSARCSAASARRCRGARR